QEPEPGVVEVEDDVLVGVDGDVDRHQQLVVVPSHEHAVTARVGPLHALQGGRDLVHVQRPGPLDGRGQHLHGRLHADLVDVVLRVELLVVPDVLGQGLGRGGVAGMRVVDQPDAVHTGRADGGRHAVGGRVVGVEGHLETGVVGGLGQVDHV